MIGWHDIETYSKYDLKVVGTDVYSRNCEVILMSYGFDDGEASLWEVGQPTGEVKDFLAEATRLVAHNAWFERNVFSQQGWSDRPLDDWGCTMAQALAHSLPGKLEVLCKVLGIPQEKQKLADGKRLITTFCKPTRSGKRNDRDSHAEKWERFCEYALLDTISMRECYKRMPRVNLDACGGT